MSRRGLYIGGHTVIGPGSGWFSGTTRKKPKATKPRRPLTPEQIAERQDEQRLAAEQRQEIKRKNRESQRREQQAAAARRAAKRVARNSPEAVAKRAELVPVIRAKLERRMESVTVIRRRLPPAPPLTTKGASLPEEHMYKAKSASIQRGALVRNSRPRMTRREEYNQTQIVLTDAEHCHFSFGFVQEYHLLTELRPVVRIFAKGGIRKPHDVARALNRAGKRTACGEPWTPRLVWFLLSKMFVSGSARKPVSRRADTPDRSPSARMLSDGSASATKHPP
jgi:hypothetical protein